MRCSKASKTIPPPSARAWKRWSSSAKPRSRCKSRTGGSTFKNPPGHKAWQLIDEAGCRGLMRGAAQVSEKHCNFLINTGDATAADIEALGEEVRARVKAKSGVELEWEIKRVGVAHDATYQARRRPAGRPLRRTRSQPVSGAGCAKALREEGFDVVEIDPGDESRRAAARRQARCRVQRAAWPLGRGRLRAGPARTAAHSLHPFRRAGLGARHAQGTHQGRLSRRRHSGREIHRRRPPRSRRASI